MKNKHRIDTLGHVDPEIVNAIEEIVAEPGYQSQDRDQFHQLCRDLRTIAPDAQESFRRNLKQQLVQHLEHQQQQRRGTMSNASIVPRVLKVLVVSMLVALVVGGVTIWGSVVDNPTDHASGMAHAPASPAAEPRSSPPVGPTPTTMPSPIDTLAELQHTVDIPLLVPLYMPDGCILSGRYRRGSQEVMLDYYGCVSITERPAGYHEIAPDVIAESQLMIHGKPAVYLDRVVQARDKPVWKEGSLQVLIFETRGVSVEIIAPPMDIFPRDELIRIAESLQPPN